MQSDSLEPALLQFGWVAGDYIKHELDSERSKLAYPTKEIYRLYIRRWILDRWQNEQLARIRGAEVEDWLDCLDLANGTRRRFATS